VTGRDDPAIHRRSDDQDALIGSLIGGKYRIVSFIARGGMGSVYRAVQEPLGRSVALKTLRCPPTADNVDEFQNRFLLEASTLARLRHPNTVIVFDYGTDAQVDGCYMVMEYIDGRPLNIVLQQEGPLAPVRALTIATEIARSLAEAHEAGIVHRDLKPSNIMIGQNHEGDVVKVVDFGIVKVSEGDQQLTHADNMVGTPRYMSPEQIRGVPLDGRADLYALGVLLYHMIMGHPPFNKPTTAATLVAHLQDPVPDLRPHAVPDAIATVIERLLEKEPEDRYATADAFRDAARAALREIGVSISTTRSQRLSATDLQFDPAGPQTLNTRRPSRQLKAKQKRSFWLVAVTLMILTIGTLLSLILVILLVASMRPDPGLIAVPEPEPPIQVQPVPVPVDVARDPRTATTEDEYRTTDPAGADPAESTSIEPEPKPVVRPRPRPRPTPTPPSDDLRNAR
jgi:serine/threonine protein kinase